MLMIFFFYAVYGNLSIERAGYWGVVAALTLYNGSVLAEVFSAGVNAVPEGSRRRRTPSGCASPR